MLYCSALVKVDTLSLSLSPRECLFGSWMNRHTRRLQLQAANCRVCNMDSFSLTFRLFRFDNLITSGGTGSRWRVGSSTSLRSSWWGNCLLKDSAPLLPGGKLLLSLYCCTVLRPPSDSFRFYSEALNFCIFCSNCILSCWCHHSFRTCTVSLHSFSTTMNAFLGLQL